MKFSKFRRRTNGFFMSKKELIKKEVAEIYLEGLSLAKDFTAKNEKNFQFDYQIWYSKALKIVSSLASDREAEFRSYYEIKPNRKNLSYGSFVIQDFMKNIVPSTRMYPDFNVREQVANLFLNQISIFNSIVERIDTFVADIEGELYAEIQDSEIVVARRLSKVSLRAAGALMGVVIEGHLQKVASLRGVKIGKTHPTIADLNEPLKAAAVIDTATWRKISYLAALRNLCSHKKDVEPTDAQVNELIDGAEWLTKNVA